MIDKESFSELDNAITSVLKEDTDKISEHLPPLVMHRDLSNRVSFHILEYRIPLDLTTEDTRTLGTYYSVLGTFASYGHDIVAKYEAKMLLLGKAIVDKEGELINAHTRGKADKDLKPTLLNKLIASDPALLQMRSNMAMYEAIKTLIKGRIAAYETRITILSREFTRRGIRTTDAH